MASAFATYHLGRSFALPADAAASDVLGDGRVVAIVGRDLYVEDDLGSGVFVFHGSLPGGQIADYGAAFLRVSPSGGKLAVGNNGGVTVGYQVGVFAFPSLSGVWVDAEHWDAEWVNDAQVAITAGEFGSPGVVTILDTSEADPQNWTNVTVIEGIGGSSGGVTFDSEGNLFTGNGFSTSRSGTGAIKAFEYAAWTAALATGPPIDFEMEGELIVDVLSAWPLGFDVEGNLYVGGGDGAGHSDFAAVVRASAVVDALGGLGSVDAEDPRLVRRLDPDSQSASNFYTVNHNGVTGELYLRDFGSTTVFAYAPRAPIPTVSGWGFCALALLMLTGGTMVFRRPGVPRALARRGRGHAG
jgi:hypothetical protein